MGLCTPWKPPIRKKFCTQEEHFTTSNCIFKFNFLALLVSEILGRPKFTLGVPRKMLMYAQVLAYAYITVEFLLRSFINVRLMESSLYNRFCIKRYPKIGFWGDFGVEAKIFGGNPLRMQWPPIYVVWWKNCGDAVNTICGSSCHFFWDCESRKIQWNIPKPTESTLVLRIAHFQTTLVQIWRAV